MLRPLNEIEHELLGLPEVARARLAHRLIISLDADVRRDDGVDTAWLEEAKRRDAEIERGEVETIPAEEAMRRAHEALTNKK
jgi:hypothetical protein